MKVILYLIFILLLSLLAIFPSFNLALFGDDWLAFFRYNKILGPQSPGQWNHLTYFLTPYGAQDILMGFLQKIYDYQSSLYFVTSFILRIMAAISFYPLVNYLTKNKLAAFFAMLFFSITTIGLDTTNWVFNMPSYISIALFNLFLYFFLKSREEKKFKLLLISGLLYYLAYVITPIRLHGSLLFILLLEAFWIFQTKDLKIFKKVALRVSLIILIFLIIKYTGQSITANEITERLTIGINTDLALLSQGRFDFIFYPLVMFGSMFIPDLRNTLGPDNLLLYRGYDFSYLRLIFLYLLPAFSGYLILLFVLMKSISLPYKFFISNLTFGFSWVMIVLLIHQANANIFFDYKYILSLTIGGLVLIIILSLIIYFFRQINTSTALFLSVSWSILSFFFAWWWVPETIFPTTYRYLIVSAVGVTIILATIVGLGKGRKQQISLFSFFLLLVIIHMTSSYSYLSQLREIRSQALFNKIWSQMPYVAEIGKNSRPIIFYFVGDGTAVNASIIYSVITFGFPPHMSVLYNVTEDTKVPLIMDSWEEVVSAVSDGKSFIKYIGKAIDPIPIDNVYIFKLEGKGNLINITDYARRELKRIKDS